MVRIKIKADCVPPPHLLAAGITIDRMEKSVPESEIESAAAEYLKACRDTGIFANHGSVTLTFAIEDS